MSVAAIATGSAFAIVPTMLAGSSSSPAHQGVTQASRLAVAPAQGVQGQHTGVVEHSWALPTLSGQAESSSTIRLASSITEYPARAGKKKHSDSTDSTSASTGTDATDSAAAATTPAVTDPAAAAITPAVPEPAAAAAVPDASSSSTDQDATDTSSSSSDDNSGDDSGGSGDNSHHGHGKHHKHGKHHSHGKHHKHSKHHKHHKHHESGSD